MKEQQSQRESDQAKEDTRVRLARIEAEMRVLVPSINLRKKKEGGGNG